MIAGIILNRVNVFLIAYRPLYATKTYVPSVAEVLVSLGLIAGTFFMYRLIVTIFPVLPSEVLNKVKPVRTEDSPHEA
jgi:Ni/Fe-hydrogenase subunit HybB-like protein